MLQLFMGRLHTRCWSSSILHPQVTSPEVAIKNDTTAIQDSQNLNNAPAFHSISDHVKLQDQAHEDSSLVCFFHKQWTAQACPDNMECAGNIVVSNPGLGYTSFDNFFWACVSILQVSTPRCGS
jgi:hypothetical protein